MFLRQQNQVGKSNGTVATIATAHIVIVIYFRSIALFPTTTTKSVLALYKTEHIHEYDLTYTEIE